MKKPIFHSRVYIPSTICHQTYFITTLLSKLSQYDNKKQTLSFQEQVRKILHIYEFIGNSLNVLLQGQYDGVVTKMIEKIYEYADKGYAYVSRACAKFCRFRICLHPGPKLCNIQPKDKVTLCHVHKRYWQIRLLYLYRLPISKDIMYYILSMLIH